MRLIPGFISIATILLPTVTAIFADNAYDTDYHHELIGLPQPETTFFYRPRKNDKASLLYTVTDLGILGAINPGTGKLLWRQILGERNATKILRGSESASIIFSAVGSEVSGWDSVSGMLKWSIEFPGNIKDLETIDTVGDESLIGNILVLYEEDGIGVVRMLKSDTGDLVWELKDKDGGIPWKLSKNLSNFFLISLLDIKDSYNIRTVVISSEKGDITHEYTIASKADIHTSDDILFAGKNSASPVLAWIDNAKKYLIINVITQTGAFKDILPIREFDSLENISIYAPNLFQSRPHFLVNMQSNNSDKAGVYHIDLKEGKIERAYELPESNRRGTISISCHDTNVYFTKITKDEMISVSSISPSILARWPVNIENSGELLHAASEVVRKSENSYAIRAAALTTSETLVMIRNGEQIWARQEGLSGAIAAEWVEIPQTENLAATLHAEAHSNPLTAYIHRVNRHFHDLYYLPGYLRNLPERVLGSIFHTQVTKKTNLLIRDIFGFNKLVMVATLRGSLYALNSGNRGTVVWLVKIAETPISKGWNVKALWGDNIAGVVSIIGSDGSFTSLNASTGGVIERTGPQTSSYTKHTAVVKSSIGRLILNMDETGIPQAITSNHTPAGPIVTRGKHGEVQGVRFDGPSNNSPIVAWTFQPNFGEEIINVVSRPSHDPVASIGKVLGDRNVLYKYLNPNIILVTSVSNKTSTAYFYLLDSISGDILHSSSHERVDIGQPIPSLLTENWFVYSVWSDVVSDVNGLPSSKGYQIVVSELFETARPNDRGPLDSTKQFSSLEPSDQANEELALPHVVTKAFLIPEPISHMIVSQTRQGITSRQLICTLPHSNSIIGIPRTILEPRRPVGRTPTPLEAEEGLSQYQPTIDFHPQMVITHEREVMGIQNIITSPSVLESTSLIFAYGLDIFGTRVTPSQAFDILGKDFNKISLLATIIALAAGVAVLAPMVKRKQINGSWMST
ncbi:Bgt-652 [Blumeria graminis f. sp. tritici]|uniref:ER membrane protein complex subunit 1 n=2 Tax=Blumeria graminis f. sp. tritici TaxID=62690 RepID=A0A9X9MG40_BLUGR|nr:hypothetical protein BGT96224_652 [Blumeria graminis f. sp. tritici 96224]VDB85988.1 Bgt-652 [Blumeria graminis f. sp. tritici]